ncbi:MAG: fused response regulator/phosphatase [Brevinematales bacterium]|nr:fused response regulator/phosphatase [Brevinematales bacterium]
MALKNYKEKRILVVDDSPVIRTLIQKCLTEEGYKYVDTAENGRDALEKCQKDPYDLVLTDFDMPEMNGEELVTALRNRYNNEIIIVVLSAQASKQKIVEMMRKADDYIIKDDIEIIKADIFFVIEKCFDTHETRKENERLLAELMERDKHMKIELETARALLGEFKELHKVTSKTFQLAFYNSMSNTIGGDFFTAQRLDNSHIGVLIGDISGHGIPAALLMLVFKNAALEAIQQGFKAEKPTATTMKILNTKLNVLFPETKYATISYLILNEEDRTVCYTNEFQNPILYSHDGVIEELDNGKLKLIGIYNEDIMPAETFQFHQDCFSLKPGEKIFLFTDGIIEARNPDTGEEFGLERLKSLLTTYASLSLSETMKQTLKIFYAFTKQQVTDDITFLGISTAKGVNDE